jgi:tripartite-type tricarboxylate transporter receptor subunit TctC
MNPSLDVGHGPLTRRRLLRSMTALTVLCTPAVRAQIAAPIRIVVPFAAGGSVDVIARLVQPGLQQRLSANVIVENRPGASGATGAAAVAKAPPDGTTWLLCFDSQALNSLIMPNLTFDAERDFEPVLLIGTGPHVLCSNPSRPYVTFAELVAAAKARPATITCSTGGNGGLTHLTALLLTKLAGIQLVYVFYRGGGPALSDAVAGHVDLVSGTMAQVALQLQAGGVRPLLQTGPTRLPALPDVPTANEFGFAGFQAMTWWGAFAPAGTSPALVDRFGAALAATLRDPPVMVRITETLQITPLLAGPEELRRFFRAQLDLWGPVVREHGIKAE